MNILTKHIDVSSCWLTLAPRVKAATGEVGPMVQADWVYGPICGDYVGDRATTAVPAESEE